MVQRNYNYIEDPSYDFSICNICGTAHQVQESLYYESNTYNEIVFEYPPDDDTFDACNDCLEAYYIEQHQALATYLEDYPNVISKINNTELLEKMPPHQLFTLMELMEYPQVILSYQPISKTYSKEVSIAPSDDYCIIIDDNKFNMKIWHLKGCLFYMEFESPNKQLCCKFVNITELLDEGIQLLFIEPFKLWKT